MPEAPDAPLRFFDCYPRFIETSDTGPWRDRLNARYAALIHANRHLFDGARVVDLASHDGRFSFAALANGAHSVVGVEHKAELVATAEQNFAHYHVAEDRYRFVHGDIFEELGRLDGADIVLCLGIFYHINDHMRLLHGVADLGPRWLILDTKVSQLEGALIEIRNPVGGSPPRAGGELEGYPTREALEVMLSYFGWEPGYIDWAAADLTGLEHVEDYRHGRRISLVVSCPEHDHPHELRDRAVALVLERQQRSRTQFITITLVARELGVSPQALRL